METNSQESPTEFVEDIEGLGQFTFAKRTMRLEIKSKVEFRRLTEGEVLDEFTTTFLEAVADLKVLILEAPKGWAPADIDKLDPYKDDSYTNVLKVWGVLRKREQPFPGA